MTLSESIVLPEEEPTIPIRGSPPLKQLRPDSVRLRLHRAHDLQSLWLEEGGKGEGDAELQTAQMFVPCSVYVGQVKLVVQNLGNVC